MNELLTAVEMFFDEAGWDLGEWSSATPSGIGRYTDAHSCTGRVSVMVEVDVDGIFMIQTREGDELFSRYIGDPKCFVIAKKVLDGVVDDY